MAGGRRKGRTSFRRRILISSVSVLLLLAVVMGSVSIYTVGRLTETDSKQILQRICEKEALQFDNKLNTVRRAAEMILQYSMDPVGYTGVRDYCSEEYLACIMNFSLAIAGRTDGAMAVYFRNDPALVKNGAEGFLFSRASDTDEFTRVPLTDIEAYDADDIGHVGWFTVPKKTGRALWMMPYYNLNLNVLMITYVIPLYLDDGTFAGVIGMDIDFSTVMNEIRDVRIYETGSVALVDTEQGLVYTMDGDGGIRAVPLSGTLSARLSDACDTGDLFTAAGANGAPSVCACRMLSNGMILYVSVPRSEINSNRNLLIISCAAATLVFFGLSVLLLSRFATRAVNPLKRLTGIAGRYAQGDWSDQYIPDTNDEIQDLSEGIAKMAANTQEYISRLNDLARKDALTGLGNATAYREAVLDIRRNRHEEFGEYAVVSMDLNDLKKANDTLGHEAGNILIREAAAYIAHTFDHSPVFRTGGDEFTAILYTDDFANREELIGAFRDRQGYPVPGLGDMRLSVSWGIAVYPEDGADYDAVFETADSRMYLKKKEMKARKEPAPER